MKILISFDDGKRTVIDVTRSATTRGCNVFVSNSDSDNNIDIPRIQAMLSDLIGEPLNIENQIVKDNVSINIKETVKW